METDKDEVFYFSSSYKHQFFFRNKDNTKHLSFTFEYRSEINKEMTINQCEKEGCEYIEVYEFPIDKRN